MPEAYHLARVPSGQPPGYDPPPQYPGRPVQASRPPAAQRVPMMSVQTTFVQTVTATASGLLAGAALGIPAALTGGVLAAHAWHGPDVWEGGQIADSRLLFSDPASVTRDRVMLTLASTTVLLGGLLGAHAPSLRPREVERLQSAVKHLAGGVYAGLCGGYVGLGVGALAGSLATAFTEPMDEEEALVARMGATAVGVLAGWTFAAWHMHTHADPRRHGVPLPRWSSRTGSSPRGRTSRQAL